MYNPNVARIIARAFYERAQLWVSFFFRPEEVRILVSATVAALATKPSVTSAVQMRPDQNIKHYEAHARS